MDKTKHTDTFSPPVFASRMLAARTRIQAAGLKFVWNEEKKEFVLLGRKAVNKLPGNGHKCRAVTALLALATS